MSSFSLLTKQKQEFLAFGYIRINADKINVPISLNYLCSSFHNENIHMIFTGEKLTKFLAIKNHDHEAVFSRTTRYKNFNLRFRIFSRWWHRLNEGRVVFKLDMEQVSEHIESVILILKIYCPQTQTQYQETTTLFPGVCICNKLLYLSECKDKEYISR